MVYGRPIGFLPEGVDDPNWELNALVEELKGELDLQQLLRPEQRLPQASVDALKASYEQAASDLKEADEAFLATLK